jgi:hypothetical protein
MAGLILSNGEALVFMVSVPYIVGDVAVMSVPWSLAWIESVLSIHRLSPHKDKDRRGGGCCSRCGSTIGFLPKTFYSKFNTYNYACLHIRIWARFEANRTFDLLARSL